MYVIVVGGGTVGYYLSRDLLERPLTAGDYRLEFDTARGEVPFFTRVALDIRVTDPARSYHVPLLLAPFSMTTAAVATATAMAVSIATDVPRRTPPTASDSQCAPR